VTIENGHRVGRNTMIYADSEVTRIGRVAFELARKRGGKLCSVDKANVLRPPKCGARKCRNCTGVIIRMWRCLTCMSIMPRCSSCATQNNFDVMVTGNIFGDILSDCAAMLTGSLGMPSGLTRGGKRWQACCSYLSQVHGSAPDIAGKGIANPIATILSAAMMLRYSFAMGEAADRIEAAVATVLASGLRTGDIMQAGSIQVGTNENDKRDHPRAERIRQE